MGLVDDILLCSAEWQTHSDASSSCGLDGFRSRAPEQVQVSMLLCFLINFEQAGRTAKTNSCFESRL